MHFSVSLDAWDILGTSQSHTCLAKGGADQTPEFKPSVLEEVSQRCASRRARAMMAAGIASGAPAGPAVPTVQFPLRPAQS